MEARSPRLSDIAARMAGKETASNKRIQSFLQDNDPLESQKTFFNEEAEFVIGYPTEIQRVRSNQMEYVCTLMDGQTKGFWMLTLATPLRGKAIPFHFLSIVRARLKISPVFATWSTSKSFKKSSS